MFAGDPRLMEFTAAATRVTQDTVTAVAWACAGAAVLERLLLGQGAAAAVRETVQELQQGGPGGWGLKIFKGITGFLGLHQMVGSRVMRRSWLLGCLPID
jgi:hypothetical protein